MVTLLVIDNGFILITALIFFIIGFFLAYKTHTNWLYAMSGLLWFIPIFIIDNVFIIIFSAIMLLFCGILAFTKEPESE